MQFTDKVLEKLQPSEYYKEWFRQHSDTRPDGRNNLEYRDTIIQKGTTSKADGSSFVKLGNTICVCAIKAEVYEVVSISPSKIGYLIPNVYMAAGSNPEVRPGAPNDQSQELSCFVNEIIDNYMMRIISETGELVAIPDKVAWCLYINIEVLSDDGNLEEAIWLCCISALTNLELPEIELTQDMTVKIPINPSKKRLNLSLRPLIFKATLFDNRLLVDPDSRDEDNSQGKILILFNANSGHDLEIMQIDLFKTNDFNPDDIKQLCKSRFEQISPLLSS